MSKLSINIGGIFVGLKNNVMFERPIKSKDEKQTDSAKRKMNNFFQARPFPRVFCFYSSSEE